MLQQAYLRNPTRADLAERFITLLMDAAAIRLASQALAQVLTRFPQHPKLRILSARAHYENGDVPAAMRDLAVALATDPKHSIARALQPNTDSTAAISTAPSTMRRSFSPAIRAIPTGG